MSSAAGFWDGEADRFDDEPDHGLRDPVVRDAWRTLLLAQLPPGPCRVVDLGCGTGSLSVLLAQAGYGVRGVDVSPRMIEQARIKARSVGVECDFAVGDAAAPPWADGSADVVLARHVLWALEDPAAALGEWVRLLAPGGRLVLVEGRWSTGAGLRAETVRELLAGHGRAAVTSQLPDPALWGGPITDERYLVLSA